MTAGAAVMKADRRHCAFVSHAARLLTSAFA